MRQLESVKCSKFSWYFILCAMPSTVQPLYHSLLGFSPVNSSYLLQRDRSYVVFMHWVRLTLQLKTLKPLQLSKEYAMNSDEISCSLRYVLLKKVFAFLQIFPRLCMNIIPFVWPGCYSCNVQLTKQYIKRFLFLLQYFMLVLYVKCYCLAALPMFIYIFYRHQSSNTALYFTHSRTNLHVCKQSPVNVWLI